MYQHGMVIISMFATLEFWLWFFAIFWNAVALIKGGLWIRRKYRHWRHRKNMDILRAKPSELKAIIKRQRDICYSQEDKITELQNERDEALRLFNEAQSEVKSLIKRNVLAANELRWEDSLDKKTQFVAPVRPGRWFHQ